MILNAFAKLRAAKLKAMYFRVLFTRMVVDAILAVF